MKYVGCLSFILGTFLSFTSCKKNDNAQTPGTVDSFQVTVMNGYGGGIYKKGDTVHIFSKEYSTNQQFGEWTGTDKSLLDASAEWHTWFIMPGRDVTFTGSLVSIPAFTLKYEMIDGKNRPKPVYYYFPTNHKGIVYLLHGTSGSAANLVSNYEWQLLIRDLVTDNFAVIITESEEATTNSDLNDDGYLRWNNIPWDTTTNVDFANIKKITETFYTRGLSDAGKPRYSIGMSNGGNFSTSLSTIYHFKTGISYCAPSGNQIAATTTTPMQFCMARFDENPAVGPTGNANALENSTTITGRGLCSKYFIKERSPLYAERFARSGDISLSASSAIFEELKAHHFIDNKNYFIGTSDDLNAAFIADPSGFPQLKNLSLTQLSFVSAQVSLAVSEHSMYSDYNRASIQFLNTQCQ
ncbi:MAG: hypothetical protein QM802_07285 [Agriterribacter sp.]